MRGEAAIRRGLQLATLLVALLLAREIWIRTAPIPPLDAPFSTVMLDQNGEILHLSLAADGRWRLPLGPGEVSPNYLAQLITYEDKRFYGHNGVDPAAMIRALAHSAAAGKVQSGGSTLTMQVARLLGGTGTGRWAGKLAQIRLAWALERRLSKEEILSIYLTRAPFGGNLEGVGAAALAYFGKPPRRLSAAEAAFLVALPQAPEARRPDRHKDAARAGRARVLARMQMAGLLSADDAARAAARPVPEGRRAMPALAPHLSRRLAAAAPVTRSAPTPQNAQPLATTSNAQPPATTSNAQPLATTLNAPLQRAVEQLLRDRLAASGNPRLSAAVIIAEAATGEIRARASGGDLLDLPRAGFLDLSAALRSPGSTLKPVIYALAFEDGIAHPETRITDAPLRFGAYEPQNFDGRYLGTITLRQALQSSRNIPAVALLERVGPVRLTSRLSRLGAAPVTPRSEAGGLALALGGAGLSLADLARIYAALSTDGSAPPLRATPAPTGPAARLTSPIAAFHVADILRGTEPPGRWQTGRIGYKTGTSYGHRDAWAVGFDGRYVVAVWMGRADAGAVPGLSGQSHAAPLLFELFDKIPGGPHPAAAPPPAALLVPGAALPPALQHFRHAGKALNAAPALEIASPPDGARVALGSAPLTLRLGPGGTAPFTWLADGRPIARSLRGRSQTLPGLSAGFTTITVIDAAGQSARVSLNLE